MRVRLIAAIVAVVLAAVGTMALLAYVRGADQRALANTETVPVLVAAAPIPQGATAESLGDKVTVTQLPRMAVLSDAATSVDQLAGLVATVPLQSGEQLLRAKFAAPDPVEQDGLVEQDATVDIPAGMQAVTIRLDQPERTVGGTIEAGDTVGVFLTFRAETRPNATHLTVHKVLVTAVQPTTGGDATAPADANAPADGSAAPADGSAPPADGSAAPADGSAAREEATTAMDDASTALADGSALAGGRYYTLAMSARDAEQVVFAAEFGTIWLSDEPESATEEGAEIVTPESAFR